MSVEAIRLPGVAVASETCRPVRFFVDRRVDLTVLTGWQRFGYRLLCRWMPKSLRIPPAPPMYRGMFDTFAEADDACKSRDDQLHILPWGWAFDGETVDADTVCRPRDKSDEGRYLTLRARYADEVDYERLTELAEVGRRLERTTERLRSVL